MAERSDTGAVSRHLAETVAPATVRIGRHGGRGGGVVVADGVVVTNAHNLRGATVTVTFADGRQATGEVRAVDADGDLAAVAVPTEGVSAPAWAGDEAVLGTAVWTVTLTPAGGVRVTAGAISSIDRAFRGPGGRLIQGSIEHTAPLARGSSGSPVLDADGRVLGFNTHRLGDGFYLALPATAQLRGRVDALAQGQAPRRRRLGVALVPPRASRRLREVVGLEGRDGLLVREVAEDSPAARAGLRRGDLLVAVGGVAVASADDLFSALAGDEPALTLTIIRATEELTVTVDFGEGEAPAAP